MCPLCITTAVLSAAGATSGAGLIAVAASRWLTLKRWFCGYLRRLAPLTAGKLAAAKSQMVSEYQ